ncbi:uncharacterized protein MKK02DRAFT_42844 [Dioszegia hungarica]|uniref:Uncharacterized protein n=1 Tax=Dioszegia hungarica TaxID=4972 RepID=A0AA38HDF0_9TREE|nr:uncharacterized protein MKK02DRAFT_42844 [Dioszegia hungarica]KAI9638451.1 hypothetical protein MKK02DRAFT_42844 [Dioszegia hungarica]
MSQVASKREFSDDHPSAWPTLGEAEGKALVTTTSDSTKTMHPKAWGPPAKKTLKAVDREILVERNRRLEQELEDSLVTQQTLEDQLEESQQLLSELRTAVDSHIDDTSLLHGMALLGAIAAGTTQKALSVNQRLVRHISHRQVVQGAQSTSLSRTLQSDCSRLGTALFKTLMAGSGDSDEAVRTADEMDRILVLKLTELGIADLKDLVLSSPDPTFQPGGTGVRSDSEGEETESEEGDNSDVSAASNGDAASVIFTGRA